MSFSRKYSENSSWHKSTDFRQFSMDYFKNRIPAEISSHFHPGVLQKFLSEFLLRFLLEFFRGFLQKIKLFSRNSFKKLCEYFSRSCYRLFRFFFPPGIPLGIPPRIIPAISLKFLQKILKLVSPEDLEGGLSKSIQHLLRPFFFGNRSGHSSTKSPEVLHRNHFTQESLQKLLQDLFFGVPQEVHQEILLGVLQKIPSKNSPSLHELIQIFLQEILRYLQVSVVLTPETLSSSFGKFVPSP